MVNPASLNLKRSWLLIIFFLGCLWGISADESRVPRIATCSWSTKNAPVITAFLEESTVLGDDKEDAAAACSCALPANLMPNITSVIQPDCPYPHIMAMIQVPSPIHQKPPGSIPINPAQVSFAELDVDVTPNDNPPFENSQGTIHRKKLTRAEKAALKAAKRAAKRQAKQAAKAARREAKLRARRAKKEANAARRAARRAARAAQKAERRRLKAERRHQRAEAKKNRRSRRKRDREARRNRRSRRKPNRRSGKKTKESAPKKPADDLFSDSNSLTVKPVFKTLTVKGFLPLFFKHMQQLTMVPARSSFVCVDSRQAHFESLRTWGGDFLEFARALTYTYDRGAEIRQADVDTALYTWIDVPLSDPLGFHYTTDMEALVRITAWLSDKYDLKGKKLVDLVNPPKALQPFLLDALMRPEHHGNVCLRLAMENDGAAGTQAHVVRMLIRSYFNLLWRKDYIGQHGPIHNKLSIIIADGLHSPKAFISVRDSKACRAASWHAAVSIGYHDEIQKRNVPSFLQMSAAEDVFTDYQHREEKKMEENITAKGVAASIVEQEKERQRRTDSESAKNTVATQAQKEDLVQAAALAVAEEMQHRAVADAQAMMSDEIKRRSSETTFLEASVSVDAQAASSANVDSTTGVWADISAGEQLEGEREAQELLNDLDPEFLSFMSQFEVDANALREVDDDNVAAGLAVDVIGGEMMRTALIQQDDHLVNALSESMGTEWVNKVVNTLSPKTHSEEAAQKDTGSLLEVSKEEEVVDKKILMSSKYRKQEEFSVLIFNEDAVMNQRKSMLTHILKTIQIGVVRDEWPKYRSRSLKHDEVYERVFASNIPHYTMHIE